KQKHVKGVNMIVFKDTAQSDSTVSLFGEPEHIVKATKPHCGPSCSFKQLQVSPPPLAVGPTAQLREVKFGFSFSTSLLKSLKMGKVKKMCWKGRLPEDKLFTSTTENTSCGVASALYCNLLVNVSKKTVQRMDIDIKRKICKGCRSLLLSGITCKVRIKKKRIIWRCLKCRTCKIFETKNKTYVPWSQRKESIVEILDYGKDAKHVK
ncbi:hypothetical protein NQ315_009564, partial [Exocentrus adspersus]